MNTPNQAANQAQALIPFTGFYTLDAQTGAFVLVDTNYLYQYLAEPSPSTGVGVLNYAATVTVSMDGTHSTVYLVGENCSFDGTTLTLSDLGSLTFTQNVSGGNVSSVSGMIGGVPVSGSTPFNAIQPAVFAATYYDQIGSTTSGGVTTYEYAPRLKINQDGSVYFAAENNGEWTQVLTYAYNFAMFVIEFAFNGGKQTFEMGTASGWGRVAGNAAGGSMLVTIQQNQPISHL
jgi:hypothetical protein